MIKKRQTNFYLTETTRQWIAQKASELKVSRSVFIHALIKHLMENEKQTEPHSGK